MADRKSILVFSAHAADFVWRADGADHETANRVSSTGNIGFVMSQLS